MDFVGKHKFLSLQFRRNTFDKLFKKYGPDYCYKEWFRNVEHMDTEYLHDTKARMYTQPAPEGEKQNSVDTIVINLERADFFPEDIQMALDLYFDMTTDVIITANAE